MPVLYETSPATGETIEVAELNVVEFYLGQKMGLLGSNAWEEQLVRSYTGSSQALFDKFVVMVIRSPKELQPQMMELYMKQIPEWASFHEKILQANGANGHYIGDKVRQHFFLHIFLFFAELSEYPANIWTTNS